MFQTKETPSTIVFSDINLYVGEVNAFTLIYNEYAIAQDLELIWTTPYKSRPFRRRFGADLAGILFEPLDRITALKIQKGMSDMVAIWEPPVTDFVINVIPDYDNQNYYVDCSYRIPELNNKLVSYNFTLSRPK